MTADTACWRRIGIAGDRSCPELERYVHCRNCPVLGQAADLMRRRDPPDGYVEAMLLSVSQPVASPQSQRSALVFRLGQDWLALETGCVVEIAADRPVHRVAHRGGPVAGLVNVRGQLLLAVHLGNLLQVTRSPAQRPGRTDGRIVVIERAGDTWAFAADRVEGVQQFSTGELAPPPVTLDPALAAVTTGTVPWRQERVALLDSAALFELLRRLVVT